jgi:hypothetical protein
VQPQRLILAGQVYYRLARVEPETRGPRGGRIIGKTRSGKPIYARRGSWPTEHREQLQAAVAHAATHAGFTAADHAEAAAVERQHAAATPAGPARDRHQFLAHGHTAVGASRATGAVQPVDVAAALDFSAGLAHTAGRHQLRFVGVKAQHPRAAHMPLARLMPEGQRGWLRRHPPAEWAARLTQHTGRDNTRLVAQYQRGERPPAIALDGKLYDGLGRAALYHALGEQLPVAHFVRS